nr:MAG TPA: hypothetical protein [Caudoviricetes sp.]
MLGNFNNISMIDKKSLEISKKAIDFRILYQYNKGKSWESPTKRTNRREQER